MTIIEKHNIRQYHSIRLKDKSLSRSKMMGWTQKQVQQIRFNVFTTLIDFNSVSVLDLGCGDGDFKAYLDARFSNFHYLGLDLHESFIKFANQRYREKEHTWFYKADFTRCQLPKVDVVLACGALSYKCQYSNYYIDCIEHFYNSANKALIFNMLDQDFFESGPVIVAHNKNEIFKKCQEICDKIVLKDDYLDNDFTIIMRKSG